MICILLILCNYKIVLIAFTSWVKLGISVRIECDLFVLRKFNINGEILKKCTLSLESLSARRVHEILK